MSFPSSLNNGKRVPKQHARQNGADIFMGNLSYDKKEKSQQASDTQTLQKAA